MSQEEDLMVLQDVLNEVVNGRTEGHACPFCSGGPLEVKLDEGHLRLDCPECRKYFDGLL